MADHLVWRHTAPPCLILGSQRIQSFKNSLPVAIVCQRPHRENGFYTSRGQACNTRIELWNSDYGHNERGGFVRQTLVRGLSQVRIRNRRYYLPSSSSPCTHIRFLHLQFEIVMGTSENTDTIPVVSVTWTFRMCARPHT
jgi:hypothetical protein